MALEFGPALNAQSLTQDGVEPVEGGAVEENVGRCVWSRHVASEGRLEVGGHVREQELIVAERGNPLRAGGGDEETVV